jgi:hypothetical protein
MATIAAKVFPDNKTSATIQDGETIVVTKVLTPGATLLKNLTDVDSQTLEDGAVIVYRESTSNFVTTTNISLTGENFMNGGNF